MPAAAGGGMGFYPRANDSCVTIRAERTPQERKPDMRGLR